MKTMQHSPGFKTLLLRLFVLFLPLFSGSFSSCKKFLDKKPDMKLAVPATLDDLDAMLDGYDILNVQYPSPGETASDDYYVTGAVFGSLNSWERYFYSWQKFDDIGGNWGAPYNVIFYANVILETLENLEEPDPVRADQIRGSALFIRAFCHFSLAQLFAPVYDPNTAAKDLGIPIRLHSDLSIVPVRSTVAETYRVILADLAAAIPKLPAVPFLKYRVSRPAAYGLLARVYLSMSDYQHAGIYADSCLSLYNHLMDYNDLDPTASTPFARFNDEVIYGAKAQYVSALSASMGRIDTVLFSWYEPDDLRKTLYFTPNQDGSMAFKGYYSGVNSPQPFVGIATDEMYLIKAECEARAGDLPSANEDLNTLLRKRWKSGTFTDYHLTDKTALIDLILKERRKELLFRTLRWTDLRRLNREPARAKTLYRKINNDVYELDPGSPRYTFQIDFRSVQQSGLQQNP